MVTNEKFEGWKPSVEYPQRGRVMINGSEQKMTITENAVMFEGPDGIWGFDRSAIRAVSLIEGEYAWSIAYSVNGEIKSVKLEVVAWWLYTTEAPRHMLMIANALFDFISEEDHNSAFKLDQHELRRIEGR
jgi:hypothetical protein